MKDKDPTDNDFLNTDQLGSTRPNLSNQSKGGSVTKSFSINRKKMVEECMLKGMSIIQMVASGLGSKQTICNDVEKIRHRWLEFDTEWFNRARLARIEAEKKLDFQYQRLLVIINDNNISIKDKLYAESLVSEVIIQKYETSSSMDPEEYIKKQIQEKINYIMNDKV